jgi:hypothetical protein
MPLFTGGYFTIDPNSRSNTGLVKSGHEAPAEQWIVDPTLPVLFQYSYGGPGQTDVVISKGMPVALTGNFAQDFRTKKLVPVITIADGTNAVCGLAPFNFTQHIPDRLTGNDPTIITEEYIELPYIPDPTECSQVLWGAVHDTILVGPVVPGVYLKPSTDQQNLGHLTIWDPQNDSPTQIVGQVLGADLNQEPTGWLKWALWDEAARRQDNLPTLPAPTPDGYPYDPAYRNGLVGGGNYLNPWLVNPQGIPGLTDGGQRSQTVWQEILTVPAASVQGTVIILNLKRQNIIPDSVTIKNNNNPVSSDTYTVDYKIGRIVFTVPQALAGGANDTNLTVEYRAPHFGTPPGWDYIGSAGAVRILLKF